ncbi:hypothetical protein Palpr_0049 [Paludibacter propionicigenes WB4]|uniref:Uncharacterized protein n=1 Tax=Paludibacter propionicigenes (strain DSM 17365 / JCM 13257 / WB4) TaxID=694427 RepID=E4T0T6_PALPW|nr:hypothetical protein [Paludibacter propionicigenes]ADQ78211.1 hypothetical protein Palpr_0049 [Paludibacter propionicigenes WB4]
MKTTNNIDVEINCEDFPYKYQEELTDKLDAISSDFNQEIINEIVLWKVNRYAKLSVNSLRLINSISTTSDKININLTEEVLKSLLSEPGVRLPMASTILRFRNPKVYQIIDQRVYRFINSGNPLPIPANKSEKNINSQIKLYFQYLEKLKHESVRLSIPFEKADRIFYLLDKDKNKEFNLKNFGSKK